MRMMMDCPRCGFSQPKDRFCANCGLDVDSHLAKPKPLWLRVLQNPNFHLGLIGLLVSAIAFYILYSRAGFVSRRVHKMLGTPIASRDAGEAEPTVTEEPERPIEEEVAEAEPAAPVEAAAVAPEPAATEPQKLEVSFYEIPREALRTLVANAENAGEGTAGRAYLVRGEATRVLESLGTAARRLGDARSLPLAPGAPLMIVTPPTTAEPFQFGFSVQITKFENHEATLRWDSQLVLSQPETTAEMAAGAPAMRAVTESNLTGSGNLGARSLLIFILEPANRRPRPEFVAKAGEGPWSIFNSEDFRAQLTDWIVIISEK